MITTKLAGAYTHAAAAAEHGDAANNDARRAADKDW